MIYIYMQSYPLFSLVFYFRSLGREITILTSNESIQRLCADNKILVILLSLQGIGTINKYNFFLFNSWSTHFKNLNYLTKCLASNLQGGYLYFSSLEVDLIGPHIISDIARNRSDIKVVYFLDGPKKRGKKILPKTIKDLWNLIVTNILYSPNYVFRRYSDYRTLSVGRYFLQVNNIKEWTNKKVYSVKFNIDLPKDLDKNLVLIIGGYSLERDSIDFGGNLCKLYLFIQKIIPNVYYKPHPGLHSIDGCLQDLSIFPYPDLPMESIDKHTRLVISHGSMAMIKLASSGVPCISLLKLLDNDSVVNRHEWENILINPSNIKISKENRIKFPNSMEQLEGLLMSYKGSDIGH